MVIRRAMKKSLINLAVKTRSYLEDHKETHDLPFISRFPIDSCEIASLVLGYIFKEEYPTIDIFIVKAEKPGSGRHFWIEARGDIFDLTADQLDHINTPIFGESLASQPHEYTIYEKNEISTELKGHDWSERLQILPTISQVVRGIA